MRCHPALLLLLLALAAPARAAVPPGFEETSLPVPGLVATGLAWAPDGSGRLFLLDKGGRVLVAALRDGALVREGGAVALSPFATEDVFTESECGLLGIAFDPNYAVNRFVYLFLTATASTQRIVRYTDVDGVGTGRTVVVDGLPTRGRNHDGGGLGFGLDGKLYWSIGDLGAGVGVDGDLRSAAAKVGRANPDGTPVSDNPFNDGAGPNDDFVWARGLRNPFTLTFEPGTGRLWVSSAGTQYEQIFVPARGDHAGWDDYENDQPAGFLPPTIKYRTNGVDVRALTAATRSAGTATFTTRTAHGFRQGERLRVEGVADASFDGTLYVASTPGPTTWTAAQAGPDAASSGGTATTQAIGGAVTGGTFYDATLFPPDYRGNYLFGDYNSGRLTRATLTAQGAVATVDPWASGFSQAVDLAVGPEGALYVASVGSGTLGRIAPAAPPQQLVVSALHLPVVEGGRAVFTVRLAQAPAAEVSVLVQRSAGDADLSVQAGAQLRFTPANWRELQAVTLAAAEDADAEADRAQFSVAAPGLATETVQALSIDGSAPPPPPPAPPPPPPPLPEAPEEEPEEDDGCGVAGGAGGAAAWLALLALLRRRR
ncbi:MAG TPA: PQQ-dependent sugar dehydrogenase [Aggregicoccus sp.]|nr:PQQ-dependent sugar dehydrogenase [Aggregicoccus sp.]